LEKEKEDMIKTIKELDARNVENERIFKE